MTDKRHENRENVFKLLFAKDFSPEISPENFYDDYAANSEEKISGKVRSAFIAVCEKRDDIDREIEGTSLKWKLSRMSTVTRNVLRLAVYELGVGEIPAKVIINEAIELVKTYDDDGAAGFVNGILNKIAREHSLIANGGESSVTGADQGSVEADVAEKEAVTEE